MNAGTRDRSRLRKLALHATLIGATAAILVWMRIANRGGAPPSPPAPGLATSPMALALYAWTALSLYWAIAARGASDAATEESSGSRLFHLAMINGAFILSFWPFAGWPAVEPIAFEFPRVLPPWPWLAPAGLAVLAFGVALAVWARVALGKHWSGAVTAKVGHELIRSGPYRWVRHPIYTGAIATYAGIALISGRLQGVIAVALVVAAYVRKIRLEDENLRRLFGPAFDEYRRTTSALLPGIY